MYRLEILDPNNYNLGVSDRAPGDADGLFGAVVEPLLAVVGPLLACRSRKRGCRLDTGFR